MVEQSVVIRLMGHILIVTPIYGGYSVVVCTSSCDLESLGSFPSSRPIVPSPKNIPRTCKTCRVEFMARKSEVTKGRAIYCSRSCKSKNNYDHLTSGSGKANPNWKGGTKSTKGYWYVKRPGHHRAMKNGYVKWADLVLEEKLGRKLLSHEIAHHVNEDKTDDSPDNLEVMDLVKHSKHHHPKTTIEPTPQPDHPSNRRYSWPPDEKLLRMRQTMSLRAIASIIGCAHKTVDKRLQRIRRP